jgi:hypothetical protein
MSPDETYQSKDRPFACPFCRGRFFIAHDGVGPVGVIHTAPICAKFTALEPIDFVAAVNDHLRSRVQ